MRVGECSSASRSWHGLSHLLAKVGQDAHKAMREGVANEQQKVSKTICCLFFSSALSTSSSLLLSTHASVRQFVLSGVDWARGWLRVSRAEIAGRCGVKGSKTNQVNNQQHTLTHTATHI